MVTRILIIFFFSSVNQKILSLLILALLWSKILCNKKKLIISMLILEALRMLNLYMLIINISCVAGTIYIRAITVMVTEAILALGVIVFMSRHKKTEIFQLY